MKRIDFYVQHLMRHGAHEVVLSSGQPVLFRFDTGERRSNNAIEHAQVTQLVQEAATPQVLKSLRMRGEAAFQHHGDGVPVQVVVKVAGAGQWEVSIARQEQGSAAAPPGPSYGAPGPTESDGHTGNGAPPVTEGVPKSAVVAPASPPPPPGPPVVPSGQLIRPGEPKVNRLLRLMAQVQASDLHLSSGVMPMVRLHGEMKPLEERAPFTPEELEALLFEILPPRHRQVFEQHRDADFAHSIDDVARFRVNYFVDRNGIGAVFRLIPFEILPPEVIGLPPQILDLCYLTKGLVLVTGPTGSGKSTTLATLVDYINQNRSDHIVTIEDPIEFVHSNKRCLVNQREVGSHTDSFKKALRAALREDPDIVLVGEMRDLETIAIAIETAETGHLVFGTLHTTSAPTTIDRVIDQFPADRQAQIRTMLSESLRGVVAQVLCRRRGGGRVAAFEVMIGNPAVSNLIREGKTYQLPSIMQTGKAQGMQTMNDHLIALVKNDLIDPEEAYVRSNDKPGIRETLKREGRPIRAISG